MFKWKEELLVNNKKVSIKEATDRQLDELLIRLRKENELQNLIADLKRKSINQDYSHTTCAYPQISTEVPIESLYHKLTDEILIHHGILGMRWGIRRRRGPDGRVIRSSKKVSEDYKRSRELKKRGSKNLSTQELRDLNQRLQLEKQFKELSPSKINQGAKIVKGLVAAGTAATTLYNLSQTPLGKDIRSAMFRVR